MTAAATPPPRARRARLRRIGAAITPLAQALAVLRPSVIAVTAFTFTLCWGEYLFASSILT